MHPYAGIFRPTKLQNIFLAFFVKIVYLWFLTR